MEKLQELTDKIISLQSISHDAPTGLREYKLDKGMAFSHTIYQSNHVSAAVFTASKGTVFPLHMHEKCKEVLICYYGEISVMSDKKLVVLKPGSVAEMDADESHMLKVREDSKMMIITIPPDFDAMAKISVNGR